MNRILIGDVREQLRTLPDESVDCVVTSPPYWGLRDYGVEGQLGLEKTPQEFVDNMVEVFRDIRRVLKSDGTLWLNLGDSYFPHNGTRGNRAAPGGDTLRGRENDYQPAPRLATGDLPLKSKDLVGIPWRVAFALQADGWYLRQDIIWAKPNPMPESVRDRCTKSHEYIFMLTKSSRYYYDHEAVKEDAVTGKWDKMPPIGGIKHQENGNPTYSGNQPSLDGKRNRRSVWNVATRPFKGAHFATFPPKLIEPCILAGARVGGVVLDPFFGAGTTGLVALQHGRNYIGIELNPEYAEIARKRLSEVQIALEEETVASQLAHDEIVDTTEPSNEVAL